jgi:ADP-ribose pyrophosphatase YjhB (NUDIX family)
MDLQKFDAFVCPTSVGALVHKEKIMLVKHKKMSVWLLPGGHVNENELPHTTAEREFWEETGIRVKAISGYQNIEGVESEYLPIPILVNLHWISEENYRGRKKSDQPNRRRISNKFPKGCEQHYSFVYLVELEGNNIKYKQNVEETDGIGWFTKNEIDDLETTDDIKNEIRMVFELNGERS